MKKISEFDLVKPKNLDNKIKQETKQINVPKLHQKVVIINGENPNIKLQEYLSNGWILKQISGSTTHTQISGLIYTTYCLIEKIY